MRKTKLFSLLAALTCATTMWAASGTWTNDNCTATLTEDGTMTFSGTGAIERKDGVGWDSYLDDLKSLIIEDGLTSIESRYPGAFHSSLILNSLDLGNGMQSIGNNAFNNCRALISVTIPASVTYIGNDVFYECKGITDVYCYPDAADLTWEEADKDDFKNDAETLCHVKASQLSAYISKFSSSVNVTFVGDLPEGGSSSTPAVNGKLPGAFSISETKQVNFSQGNLQYNSDTQEWQFAANQYSYVGNDDGVGNENVTEDGIADNSGIVDMFGWVGESSTWDGLKQYGITTAESGYGNSASENLKSDWGTLMGTGWFTLSTEQWNYLFNSRTCAYRFAKAKLLGTTFGIIIFPDNYTHPDGVAAVEMLNDEHFNNGNQYNAADWGKMEEAGAVFLPAAGYRNSGGGVSNCEQWGYYWSSSPYTSNAANAYAMRFTWQSMDPMYYSGVRNQGYSVRLVTEAAPAPTPDPTPATPETSDNVDDIEDAMAALIGTGATDLTIVRDLYKDGFFNTICLPFSLNASELAASPLAGCKLYSLSDASYDGDNKLDLTIAEESTIEAGMPYLIKWSNASDITSMTFTGVTVTASTGSTVTKGTGTSQVRFVGTIGRSKLPAGEENYLFLGSGDNLYYPSSGDVTSMKGFRAYFIVDSETSGDVQRHAPARLVIAPKMPTAVDQVQGDNVQSTKVIENGQLFIIKNGVKYNAQGKVVK